MRNGERQKALEKRHWKKALDSRLRGNDGKKTIPASSLRHSRTGGNPEPFAFVIPASLAEARRESSSKHEMFRQIMPIRISFFNKAQFP